MTTDTDLREQLQRLTDRAEIYDCIQRYTRGMDRRDGRWGRRSRPQ